MVERISSGKADMGIARFQFDAKHADRVKYTAGYAELPLDIKLAVFDLIHYYEHEENVTLKSLGSATLENPFAIAQTNFPAHITRVLNLYRVPYALVM